MLRFLSVVSLLFIFQELSAQSLQNSTACDSLETGKFYVLNGNDTCFITRTKNRQFEQCNGSDETYELILIWLKPNKYILRDIHYNPTNAPKIMRNDVVMTIIERHTLYHIVHVRKKGQKAFNMTVYCLNS